MEENNNELVEVTIEENDGTEERSGMSTGLAMLIGGGLALAGFAGIKKLRGVLADRKAKKDEAVADVDVEDIQTEDDDDSDDTTE